MKQTTSGKSVSVIIPVFNGEAFLLQALESVFNQTFRGFEVIVVDDGSSDNTRKIIENFDQPISYFYQPNSGAGAARNRGVAASNSELIAFLDADDYWLPHKLEAQVRELADNPMLDAVTGHLKNVLQSEWIDREKCDKGCLDGTIVGYSPTAILIRRESFFKVGEYETESRVGEVVDWFVRARETGLNILVLDELLVWRRVHRNNNGLKNKAFAQDYVKALKRSIDRRRIAQIGGKN